jgi:hypothetical protein
MATATWTKRSSGALKGRMGRGARIDLKARTPARAAALPERDERRPRTTRYPIDMKTFVALKQRAPRTRTGAKAMSTVARDGRLGARRVRGARAARAMLAGPPPAAPAPVREFAGISATGWLPPDCTSAVGPSHVVASVNSSVAVYRKTGGAALLQRTLTVWFANVAANLTIFDPKLLYDQYAGRWVLLAVAVRENPNRSFFLLSVSASGDPLGVWRNYALDAARDGTTQTNNWADYPGLGVDPQALYLTANMFRFNGNFQYAKLRIVPKAGPYSGGPLTFTDFVRLRNRNGTMAFTVTPCHTFGAPGAQFLVNSLYPSLAAPTQNALTLWMVQNPTASPTLTARPVPTSPFGLPPDAAQRGGGTPLDSGDVRVLSAASRGGSVWAALTTQQNWGTGGNVAAIHWFQINATSGTLVQQGIYGTGGLHYFYPALMPDTNGNLIVVFSRSGANEFASARYTGRLATDPLGQLQPSALLRAGVANYTGLDGSGRNRWGDYNGIGIDPTDARTGWFYSMFAAGATAWNTRIGSARY